MAKTAKSIELMRQKDIVALRQQLAEKRAALQKERVDLAFGHSTKPSVVAHLRQEIAQLQTIIRQKESAHAQ